MSVKVGISPIAWQNDDLPDISTREMISVVPIAVVVILFGVYPMPLIDMIKTSLVNLIQIIPG